MIKESKDIKELETVIKIHQATINMHQNTIAVMEASMTNRALSLIMWKGVCLVQAFVIAILILCMVK